MRRHSVNKYFEFVNSFGWARRPVQVPVRGYGSAVLNRKLKWFHRGRRSWVVADR